MANEAQLTLAVALKDTASKGLKALSGTVEGLGKAAAGLAVGGLAAGTAGVAALSGVLVGSIGNARESMAVMAQTEAAIKSTGGAAGFTAQQISDMAGELSAAAGKSLFGDEDIQRGQNLLLTFTNIKETLPEATSVMVDMAQAMGTDVKGGAIQLGKALNDPIKGITALTRVGVTFDDKQKDLIETLVKSGKTADAQRVILKELNKEFGGSAAAAAAADGGFAQLKDQWGEMTEGIGKELLPAVTKLMSFLTGPQVQGAAQFLADALVGGVTTAIDWLTGTAIPTVQRFVANVKDLWGDLKDGFDEGGVQGAIDNLLGRLGDVVPGLQPLTDWLQTTVPPLLQDVRQGFGLMRDAVLTFVQAIQGDWVSSSQINPLHDAIGKLGLDAAGVFQWFKNTGLPDLQQAFNDALPGNIQLVNDLTTALQNFRNEADTTKTDTATIFDWATDPNASPAIYINEVVSDFQWMGGEVRKIAILAGQDFGVFANQIGSLGGKIGAGLTTAGSNIQAFGGQVAATARLAASDAQVMATQISTAVTTFAGRLRAEGTAAWSSLYNAAQTANRFVVNAINGIQTAVAGMASAVGTGINTAVGYLAAFPGRAAAAVGNLGRLLYGAGASLVQGLIDGIGSMFAPVQRKLGALTSMLPSWKGPPERDASLLFENGKLIIQGLVKGFDSMTPAVREKLKAITDSISAVFDTGTKGIDFFGKLGTFKRPDTTSIQSFAGAVSDTVQILINTTKGFKAKAVEAAGTFADGASKVLGMVGSGVDALSKISTYKGVTRDAVVLFANDLYGTVTTLQVVVAGFTKDALDAAAAWADGAGKVISIVGSGVDALLRIKDYTKGVTRDAVVLFANDLYGTVSTLQVVVRDFNRDAMKAAGLWADDAAKVVGVISSGVDGLLKIREYKGVTQQAVWGFAHDLKEAVMALDSIARDFNKDAVAAAGVWAESAGKVVGVIGAGVDGLLKLGDLKSLPAAALDLLVQGLKLAVQKMGDAAKLFTEDFLAPAVAFADAAGKVIAPISNAIETFTKLKDYKGVLPAAVQLIVNDIKGTVGYFAAAVSGMMSDGVTAAAAFADAAGTITSSIGSAVDALSKVAAYKGLDPKKLTQFFSDLQALMQQAGQVASTGFADVWQQAFDMVTPDMALALQTTLQDLTDTTIRPWLLGQLVVLRDGGARMINALAAGISGASGSATGAASNLGAEIAAALQSGFGHPTLTFTIVGSGGGGGSSFTPGDTTGHPVSTKQPRDPGTPPATPPPPANRNSMQPPIVTNHITIHVSNDKNEIMDALRGLGVA